MAGDVTDIGGRKPARKKPARKAPMEIVPAYEPGQREYELRLEGKSWPQIARTCKHTTPEAAQIAHGRYIQRAALALSKEKREAALQMEVDRLDTLQAAYWELAVKGRADPEFPGLPQFPDAKAAEVVLKIIAQRVKLLGLDEADRSASGPRTVVVTGNSEQYVATLKSLIDGAGAGAVVDAEVVDDDD